MKNIKGNKYLLSTLESMAVRGRAAHTVLLYGEKGCGKKLVADYYTHLLMCESLVDGKPCGKCRGCKNTDAGTHPDVMYVPKSGKLGGFSVETVRSIISSAYVKPNNSSGKKVYIFADCHNMDTRPQNALLKLVEEPPDYAYFIFTSDSMSDLLPTIISRSVCLGVSACTEDECREALRESGCSETDIERAVECFHGNIGMAIDYIVDERLRKNVDLTKSLADSIIKRDEYTLNASFYLLGRERSDIKSVLSMLDMLVRDAAVYARDESAALIGCCRSSAVRLSQVLTPGLAARVHRQIENAWRAVEANVSVPLVLAALCTEIADMTA